MGYRKKLRATIPLKRFCLLIPVLCLLILLSLRLPEVSLIEQGTFRKLLPREERVKKMGLGELGELMVAMLPDDLAFTIFVPSEEAFEHFLKLRANESLGGDQMNNTIAILSRVMGFSAVPQHLPSSVIPLRQEMSLESISGHILNAWKASNGTLFVNNVRSEWVDVRKAETIVHIMSGVIMDAEFKQSFESDDED